MQLETRRDWLAKQGLAIAGSRGKFSNAAKAALAKADSEGYQFLDGPSPSGPLPLKTTISKAGGQKEETPVVSDVRQSLYVLPSDFRFPELEYVAVAHIDGKRKTFSMRECCNTCRVSLTNHACASPSIHGNIAVTIERR